MSILLAVGFFLIITVLGFCLGIISEDGCTHFGFLVALGFIALIGFGCIAQAFKNTPTALDVYQGKTELRITYDGKVPVDTTVIYKKGGE